MKLAWINQKLVYGRPIAFLFMFAFIAIIGVLAQPKAVFAMAVPEAAGVVVYAQNDATIDASNLSDGYVMIKYTGTSTARLKAIITKDGGVGYNYDLNTNGNYEVFPLTEGNGNYTVAVYQNTTGTKYATLLSQAVSVSLKNEFSPYLFSNQYVNYSRTSQAVAKAGELVSGKTTDIEKVEAVYDYVVLNLTYDKEKAATVQSGYLPSVDQIMEIKKGICFDYAALMTAMLRSQGIPTKLVIGYAGNVYHAWISTYTKEQGWVENVIFFNGKEWKIMDPTFASSAQSSDTVMQFIGDGTNYTAKYYY